VRNVTDIIRRTQTRLTKSIGERVKALRTERGMTLAELGEKTNLSTSYLSQIERDKTTPSLSTLTGIAKTLNVGLRYFFETEVEAAFIVRADEVQDNFVADSSIVRLPLSPKAENNKLEVNRAIIKPHIPSESLAPYPGEDFAFVLSGELTITVGDEEFVLAAGDSIHYDAMQPHCWGNQGDEPCVVMCSHSAPWSERPTS
jgi:transcriptional regulator with XRE-family HTH domain